MACSAVASAEGVRSAVGKAAASLALAATLLAPEVAFARTVDDYAGLKPCATSAAFAKREKNEVKQLTKRLKNVRSPARRGVLKSSPSTMLSGLAHAPPLPQRAPAAARRPAALCMPRCRAGCWRPPLALLRHSRSNR